MAVKKKITQQLLAKKLGVTHSTISRSFTGSPEISPDMRMKVLTLAEKLGYKHSPHKNFKPDKLNANLNIGVLISLKKESFTKRFMAENPGYKVLSGILENSVGRQANIQFAFTNPKEKSLKNPSFKRIKALQMRAWDALV